MIIGGVMLIISVITLGIAVWAFVDCLTRRADAFPAVDRQTKPAWLLFLGLALVIQLLPWIAGGSPIGLLGLIAVVVSGFYLVDVRVKVAEISRGRRR